MPSEQAAATTAADALEPLPQRRRRDSGIGPPSRANVLFVLPYLVILLLFLVVPMLLGIALSLQDYDMRAGSNGWIGLDNFLVLLHDRAFRGVVRNTILFVAMTTPAFVLLGLFLALALNNPRRRSAVFRSIFLASSVLSVSVVTLVWRIVYLPDRGLAGFVGRIVGLASVDLVHSQALALPAIAIVTLWWLIGLPMALFLAELQRVPADVYEAAALDNASRLRTLWFITLPSIRRTIVLVAVIEVVLQFQVFGQALLITGGGPDNASRPIVQYIFETGFRDQQFGAAAAASQVLFAFILLAALVQMWVGRRRRGG